MLSDFLRQANQMLVSIKITDKLFFTKNLNLMIRSGIPLMQALDSLALQTDNIKFQEILRAIAANIKTGKSFSDSLEKFPKVFSEIFVNMIRAGEESGKLEEVLYTLGNQLYKDNDLRSKVKGALAYPVVVLSAMVLIVTGLVVFIIPRLTDMFLQAGMDLPLPTRILIGTSNFLIHYSYVVIAAVVITVVFFLRFRQTMSGKRILHKILLKMPVISKLAMKVNLARFSRTLSSLLKTDIPVVRSFLIASKVLGNIYYSTALAQVSEELKTGSSIHKALKEHGQIFPPTIIQMVAVGEETGTLDEILEEIAKFYEEDLDNTLKNLPSLVEPILILLLGVVVGGGAVAIMLPIYSLSQAAG